jgi:hypothetical protein
LGPALLDPDVNLAFPLSTKTLAAIGRAVKDGELLRGEVECCPHCGHTLKIPTVRIPIADRTVISLELLEGENWRVLKSKKVLLVGQQAAATSN